MQKKSDNKKKRATSKAFDDGYSTGNESEVGSVDDYVADEAFFDSNEFLPRKRVASMKTIKALRDVQKQKKDVNKEKDEEDEEENEDESEKDEESDDEDFGKRASKIRSQRKRDSQEKEKSQKQRIKEAYDALEQKRRYFAMIDKHKLVIEKM